MLERLIAATDGSCLKNPGPCAWAWVLADADGVPRRWAAGGLGHGTNNIGELTALLKLLEAMDPDQPLEIRMDSLYALKAVTEWLPGWKRRGWKNSAGKPVQNQDLIRAIEALLVGRDVKLTHVRGHQLNGDPLNAIADEKANAAAHTQTTTTGTL